MKKPRANLRPAARPQAGAEAAELTGIESVGPEDFKISPVKAVQFTVIAERPGTRYQARVEAFGKTEARAIFERQNKKSGYVITHVLAPEELPPTPTSIPT
jgi:hypothetical protein